MWSMEFLTKTPKYSQVWKEDSGDIEDQTVTIKEVVWSSEKKDYVNK